jgi:hypothetical protein
MMSGGVCVVLMGLSRGPLPKPGQGALQPLRFCPTGIPAAPSLRPRTRRRCPGHYPLTSGKKKKQTHSVRNFIRALRTICSPDCHIGNPQFETNSRTSRTSHELSKCVLHFYFVRNAHKTFTTCTRGCDCKPCVYFVILTLTLYHRESKA